MQQSLEDEVIADSEDSLCENGRVGDYVKTAFSLKTSFIGAF